MPRFLLETPFDVAPTSASKFEIYDAEDQYILGNAIDPIQKYDGTDFVPLQGNAPKGNILAVYKGMLIVAGDPAFPHKFWVSHLFNGEGWSRDTGWGEVYPNDGGKINGFAIQDDELKISKSNGRLYGWQIFEDGNPDNSRLRVIEDDKGMVNQKSVAVVDNVMYYLDRNQFDQIPVAKKGGLSYSVQEIIDGVRSFNNTNIGGTDGKVYIALGDITIDVGDETTITGAVLVYDTVLDGFYIRDNIDARVFSTFIASETEDFYFGDSSGRVFKLNDGLTAGGDPIHMRIRTKPFLRELGKMLHIKKVGIYMDDPDGTVVTYRTDLNEAFKNELGSVVEEPVHWFRPEQIKGPLLQLEFGHGNIKARPRLVAIEIHYITEGDG